jgi:hypothetical protein
MKLSEFKMYREWIESCLTAGPKDKAAEILDLAEAMIKLKLASVFKNPHRPEVYDTGEQDPLTTAD